MFFFEFHKFYKFYATDNKFCSKFYNKLHKFYVNCIGSRPALLPTQQTDRQTDTHTHAHARTNMHTHTKP